MKVREITTIAIMVSMSFILSYFKLFASIALDSMPAFLALLIWKDNKSANIAALAHILTAISSGLPFGLFSHLMIAALMYITLWIARKYIIKLSLVLTIFFIYIANVIIMPLCIFSFMEWSFVLYLTLVSSLTIAVLINMLFALILYRPLTRYMSND